MKERDRLVDMIPSSAINVSQYIQNICTYRSHWLAIVVGNKALEEWDGSLKLLLGQESEDTDLSKTSVVQFLDKTASLGLCRLVLGETEWVCCSLGKQDSLVRKYGS
jgi:hypothetical protein